MNNLPPEDQRKLDNQFRILDAPIDLASMRYLNESAIRDYALGCSKKYRAGKFTRVGQEFIDEVKADVECVLRSLRAEKRQMTHAPEDTSGERFVTGEMVDKLQLIFNGLVGRIIQRKVEKQPTVGKTLGRTR